MEAATTLGLSPQQVNEMYEQLVREGFIRTTKPPGTEAPTQPTTPPGAFPPAAQPTNQPTGGTSDIPKRREENQPFIET
jgi:DNA-binding transcriptional MocR family regulator